MNNRILEIKHFLEKGDAHSALRLIEIAMLHGPDYKDQLLHFKGLAYAIMGDLKKSERYFRDISKAYQNPDFRNDYGLLLMLNQQYDEAGVQFLTCLDIDPLHVQAKANIKHLLEQKKDPHFTILTLEKVSEKCPGEFWINLELGNAFFDIEEFTRSIQYYRIATSIDPFDKRVKLNLAAALVESGAVNEAIAVLDDLISHDDKFAQAFYNRGHAYLQVGKYAQGLEDLTKAVEIEPDNALYHFAKGNAEQEHLDYESAISSYLKTIRLVPSFTNAKVNLALSKLSLGNYAEGFSDLEARWANLESYLDRHNLHVTRWTGQSLKGKKLLVINEQGLGDFIQFARFIPKLSQLECKVLLQIDQQFSRIIRSLPGDFEYVVRGEDAPKADYLVSVVSLPKILDIKKAEDLAGESPYIFPKDESVSRWKRDITGTGRKVGLFWRGSTPASKIYSRSMATRRVSLMDLLRAMPKSVDLFSIQLAPTEEEKRALLDFSVTDLSDQISDFEDTAAICANLDLVVGIDSSVAHLAGAMGKQGYVLLPYVCDWRWGVRGPKTVWYPSLKLLRQSETRDWKSVMLELEQELLKN